MTKVQFIKTTGGEELAVLPRAEYERLTALATDEDVGTARLVRKARAAVESGQEVLLPKVVVDRLAARENPVRVLREWRGMTQSMLAQAIETTQGYVSDIESGNRKGTIVLHRKIARALGVSIDLLLSIVVSDEEANPGRAAKRQEVVRKMRRQRGFE
jgi:DNA-binding XRE family transcriptional regulator